MIFHRPVILGVQRAYGAVGSDAGVASMAENIARAVSSDRDERKLSYREQHFYSRFVNLKTMAAEPTCAWTAIWLPVLLSGLLAFIISVGVGTGYVR